MFASLMRGVRTAVALGGGYLITTFLHSTPVGIAAVPLLNMLGKYIRDKHQDGQYDWIPF